MLIFSFINFSYLFILSFFSHPWIILFIFYFYTQSILASLFIFLHIFLQLFSYTLSMTYILFNLILSYSHFSINTNALASNIILIQIVIYSYQIFRFLKSTTSDYFSYFKTVHFIFNIYFIYNQLNCIFSLYTSENLNKIEIYSI